MDTAYKLYFSASPPKICIASLLSYYMLWFIAYEIPVISRIRYPYVYEDEPIGPRKWFNSVMQKIPMHLSTAMTTAITRYFGVSALQTHLKLVILFENRFSIIDNLRMTVADKTFQWRACDKWSKMAIHVCCQHHCCWMQCWIWQCLPFLYQ